MRKLLLLLLMLTTISMAWASASPAPEYRISASEDEWLQEDPPAPPEYTAPPVFMIEDDPEAQTVTITATGNGHICLYLGEGEQLIAEGEGTASYIVDYVENPDGEEMIFSATAAEEGKLVSDYAYEFVYVPGKIVELYETPAPEIYAELTDEALVITATGEGTVTLHVQCIDDGTEEVAAGESPVAIIIYRGEEDAYINYWATAQANEDALIGTTDVVYYEVPALDDPGPDPYDPHNDGTWLVIYDKDGEEVFYRFGYDEEYFWDHELNYSILDDDCILVPIVIATFGNYQKNGFDVKFYVLNDGKRYGPTEDMDSLIFGGAYWDYLENLKSNPLTENDNCFTLKLGDLGGGTGTYIFKYSVENGVPVLQASTYYVPRTGLSTYSYIHVINKNGEIKSFKGGNIDLYCDEYGTGNVPFYFYFSNGQMTWTTGAETDMLEAVIDNPFVQKTYGGSNKFTVPAGFRYKISYITEELVGQYSESNRYLFVQQLDSLVNPIENSVFSIDEPTILTGDYQTFRARVEFKEEYATQVSDVKLEIVLPYNSEFVENSVMVDNKLSGYSRKEEYDFYDHYSIITVPIADHSQSVRLCATPYFEGYSSSEAFVIYNLNGETYRKSIGLTSFCVTDASIYVTPVSSDSRITVYGIAAGGKTVKVYDGDVLIAETTCLANGSWRVECNLHQPINPSVHPIHATIKTSDDIEIYTESVEVDYRLSAPQPNTITMCFLGNMNVFDFINQTTLPSDYNVPNNSVTYYFTFVANLKGTTTTVQNLKFKMLDTKGKITTKNGDYMPSRNEWVCQVSYPDVNKLPITVGLSYDYVWEGVLCHYENDFSDNTNGVTPNVTPHIELTDPSGYVYEGVPSNRLQGVTATCYYKDPETGEAVLWDAEQYEQQNPLITDERGYYRWDVPVGQWQVKYEKEGYETTFSDWLPVPPPQLDVNIGMVQRSHPEVIKAHAYPQAVDLEFDKYMFPETLTTDNITVSVNGTAVSGTIELLNAEVDDPDAITSLRRSKGTGMTLASRVRFNAEQPFNADKVTLLVKNAVTSYAGVQMASDYEAVLPLELEMQQIAADSLVVVPFMGEKRITVSVVPAAAAAGKILNVTSVAPLIASTNAEQYTLDSNGKAIISVHGDLLGMTSLLFSVEGYDLTASTLINVEIVENPGLKGDVNGDGTVNIADINKLIDYILGGKINSETMERGDVNGDNTINVADINVVIQIILGSPASRAAVNTADLLRVHDLTLRPGETGELSVTVDNALRYSALQCDITLPEGLTLVGAATTDGCMIETGAVNDFTSRAMTYSMNLLPFGGDSQPVLTLTVRADAALSDLSRVTLTDVVLADVDGVAWYADDCAATVHNASGVTDLNGPSKQVASVRYYNVAGQEMTRPEGITIQVTTYTDGTRSTTRLIN